MPPPPRKTTTTTITGTDVASSPRDTKTFFDALMKYDVGAGSGELRRGRPLKAVSENALLLKGKIPLLEGPPRSASQDGAAAKKVTDTTTTDDGEYLRTTTSMKKVKNKIIAYISYI